MNWAKGKIGLCVLQYSLGIVILIEAVRFVLPSAVPVIFNGLRLGLVFSLLGVIGAEIIAAEHGLGQNLSVLAASFKTNGVFGLIFLLAFFGVGISWGMTALENRLLRWR